MLRQGGTRSRKGRKGGDVNSEHTKPAWSFHRGALGKVKAKGWEASQQGRREGALSKDRVYGLNAGASVSL